MTTIERVSKSEFLKILKRVPLSAVECLVVRKDRLLLVKRDIEPFRGMWHLPGGFVGYNEPLARTVRRVVKKELHVSVQRADVLGSADYINMDPRGHIIAHYFKVAISGTPRGSVEGRETKWFSPAHLPRNMIHFQRRFAKKFLT